MNFRHHKLLLSGLLLAAATVVHAATNDITTALQKGLFEEEANHNLAAAIQAYQSAITLFDKDRKLAATAIFRLGECYRKQGDTNQAAAQYERVVREFGDQPELVALSRQYLGVQSGIAVGTPLRYQWRKDGTMVTNGATQEQKRLLEEEIKVVEKKLASQQKMLEVGAVPPDALADTRREVLSLKRQLAALEVGQPAVQEQKRLLQEEIKLAEEKLASLKKMLEMGKADQDAEWAAQREVLELKRQLAALDAGQPATRAAIEPAIPSAEADEIARIQDMIKNSPDLINAKDAEGQTPLLRAAAKGQVIVAQYLLQNGADPNLKGGNATTPLYEAADHGHRAVVELLLKHGALVDVPNRWALTALHRAASAGYKNVAEVLLANKANVNARDQVGDTPLHKAADAGQAAMVELLLANKADVNAKNTGPAQRDLSPSDKTRDATPLVQAILGQHTAIIRLLLARKAEVNFECEGYLGNYLGADPRQWGSPLYFAALMKNPESVKLLLEHNANPNALAHGPGETDFRWTPLGAAVKYGQKEITELLLAHGADPNIADKEGQTPLFYAVYQQTKDLAKLLLTNKAKVNWQNEYGRTPLSLAASGSDNETAALLLEHKADPNLADQAGDTPLHYAVQSGRKGMVELLLDKGANPNLRDNAGNTPLALIKTSGSRLATPGMPGMLPQPGAFTRPIGIPGQPLRIGVAPSQSSEQRATADQLAEVLRQHGASEDLPQMNQIQVRRPSANYSEVVLTKGTNNYNRFTLLELIAIHYGFVTAAAPRPLYYSTLSWTLRNSIAFPDLEHLSIRHPPAPNQAGWNERRVSLNAILLQTPDCSRDIPLEWGDVVEISEVDHPLNAVWQGLPEDILVRLKRCVDRQVQLTVKGQTTNLFLGIETKPTGFVMHSSTEREGNPPSFMLLPVLQKSGLLRASSDLSRVKVKRTDHATGQTYELVLDCSQWPGPDFWLRDGDAIEVPEKP